MPSWSLSEFLGLIDARSVCWGIVDIGESDGFAVKAPDAAMFYAMIEGSATIQSSASGAVALKSGEVAIMFTHFGQAIRAASGAKLHTVDFIDKDEYGDMLRHVRLSPSPTASVLCGRIKMRWPAGLDPSWIPPSIRVPQDKNVIKLPELLASAKSFGASAVLTRAAALLIIMALRDDPQAQAIFRDANYRDPVARAIQYMQLHPSVPWTVAMLAQKVGMARSTFAARFASETGKPPIEILTDLRMNQAAELLMKSDLKIAEIAERVGYNSQSAFSRRFEKSFDMTPGKMRLSRSRRRESLSGHALTFRAGMS